MQNIRTPRIGRKDVGTKAGWKSRFHFVALWRRQYLGSYSLMLHGIRSYCPVELFSDVIPHMTQSKYVKLTPDNIMQDLPLINRTNGFWFIILTNTVYSIFVKSCPNPYSVHK
jgi:hypothetical protein